MKTAILGSALSKKDAPFQDPEWRIWACSPANIDLSRWDEWFELHTYTGCVTLYPGYLEHLQRAGDRVVWMAAPMAEIPAARLFDHARLVAQFGRNFLTSSIAWMMAEALLRSQPGDEIALFGVDMAAAGEYADQRAGCLHFVEIAALMRVQISIHPTSPLLRSARLYGVEAPSLLEADIAQRLAVHEEALATARRRRDLLDEEIAQRTGAITALKETLRLNFGVT